MTHDWNPRPHDRLNDALDGCPSFEFDGIGSTLFNETPCIHNGIFLRRVVGHKGHIPNNQGKSSAPDHCFRMVDHLIHGHRNRGFVAEHDHSQRVPNQNHVNPRAVHQKGGWIVVGGEHGDLLALSLLLQNVRNGDFLSFHCLRSPSWLEVRPRLMKYPD